jgi:hypothetical protein
MEQKGIKVITPQPMSFNPAEHSPSSMEFPECPPSGNGAHNWLYRVTHLMVSAGYSDSDISAWTSHWMSRPPQPNEIDNTLRKVRVEIESPTEAKVIMPKPPINPTLISEFTSLGDTKISEIEALSPIPVSEVSTGDALRAIYDEGDKTIIFTDERSQGQLVWHHGVPDTELDAIINNNETGAFMLLNPVSGEFKHSERLGKSSRRSEETLTKYKYCLIEADNTPVETWLTILKQQPLPIRSISLSGNESAHSIIQLDAKDKKQWSEWVARIATMLVPMGACPGSLTAVRLTRLPNVMRKDTQKLQRLIYLNTKPKWKPVWSPSKTS